jgi:hypothetical protein
MEVPAIDEPFCHIRLVVGSIHTAVVQTLFSQLLPAGVHAAHAAPPAPQTALVSPGWQTPFASQQPVGQLAASHWHTPSTHDWSAGHAVQAAPSMPHWALVGGVTHVVPTQQPVAQSAALQYAVQA